MNIRTRLGLCIGIAIVAASIFVLSYVTGKRSHAAHTRALIRRLQAMGTTHVIFDYQVDREYLFDFEAEMPGPRLLKGILGEEAFCEVVGVQFFSLSDRAGLSGLSAVPKLRFLQIYGGDISPIDDADLACISRLPSLRVLSLPGVHITRDGFRHVSKLAELAILDIRGIDVGDEVVEEVMKLKHLEYLYTEGTRISESGLERLREQMPHCWVGRCVSESFLFNIEPFG